MSADLVKLQTELGANHTYRESEHIFSMFSRSKRYINNHDRIKHTAEQVGGQVGIGVHDGREYPLKQGLSPETNVIALFDWADNCWQIVGALTPLCASITHILNWFYLSMKIQNIALPEDLKPKLVRITWHLWRGKTESALNRLDSFSFPLFNLRQP